MYLRGIFLCTYIMSDYLAKLLVLMDTLYTLPFFHVKIHFRSCLYSKYCDTSQAKRKTRKRWKIDLELLRYNSLKAQDVYELPHMLLVMKLYEENCRSNSAAKITTLCYFVHNNSPVLEI